MKAFALRLLVFATAFLGLGFLASNTLWNILAPRLGQRMSILFERDLSNYSSVLLGTSVFASYYVDREEQTIWKAFEREMGLVTLPAAFNGAGAGDMLAIARHLSTRLPAKTLVFVEIHPAKAWNRSAAYYRELPPFAGHYDDESFLRRTWFSMGQPLLAGLVHLKEILKNSRLQGSGGNYDRVWDRDGDFALKRYRAMEQRFVPSDVTSTVDFSIIEEIHSQLERHDLRSVFVMTPLNEALIARYATPSNSFSQFADQYHRALSHFLKAHDFAFIDLHAAIPPNGFADLFHPNALGNAILARDLATRTRNLLDTSATTSTQAN